MEPNNDYECLCNQIERINPEAAEYLRNGAPALMSFRPRRDLMSAFVWAETPHEHDFWAHINRVLADLEYASYTTLYGA